ncbi:BBT_collapsed_G0039400.mRNA.1.CDS.1 [Saccharomyces cerevisiae]|nr:BBT_collapsed_G0039400.mRNA.1.CDS.1 [Saccharomyces cerevisiae]
MDAQLEWASSLVPKRQLQQQQQQQQQEQLQLQQQDFHKDQLMTVGMRIRQRVDQGYASRTPSTSDASLQPGVIRDYSSVIVPQFTRSPLPTANSLPPMLINQRTMSTEASSLEKWDVAEPAAEHEAMVNGSKRRL